MQVQMLTSAFRVSAKPTFKRITVAQPLKNGTQCRPQQLSVPTANFHHLAVSSLAPLPALNLGITALAACGINVAGSRNFAKDFDKTETDRLSPRLEGRPIYLDPYQEYAYSEAKLVEMKKKLKQQGLMKDPPKKPPIM